jgi:predicted nucleotide-binding protein
MSNLELFEDLLQRAANLPEQDRNALNVFRSRASMLIRHVFGESSMYMRELNSISFESVAFPTLDGGSAKWQAGQRRLVKLCKTMVEELVVFGEATALGPHKGGQLKVNSRIFLVHGQDETMKQSVARVIERLGLDPIILHEQPNRGRTIIEKFTDYSNVGFAVILLSPDDLGYENNKMPIIPRPRARQNVILEMGFFLGKLGRERVFVLYPENIGLELPSDYSGVLYTKYDVAGRWQLELVQELKAVGYDVDANKLVRGN